MAGDNEDQIILCKKTQEETSEVEKEHYRRSCILRLVLALLVISSVISLCAFSCLQDSCILRLTNTPEQLHLSLGADDTEYYVTWSTKEPSDTFLLWHKEPFDGLSSAKGIRVDGTFTSTDVGSTMGQEYHKYSYRAKMQVDSDSVYYYKVVACNQLANDDTGCDVISLKTFNRQAHSSKTYSFRTKNFDDPKRPLNMMFYGDLGLLNAQSVPRLTKEIDQNDLIIHNGDFAYDLNTEMGNYGDKFMRLMEPIAARIPYQTSVGNHEIAGNFSEYNHRFTMINRGPVNHGEQNNFYYSFNAGPVHFVAISTEFYYFLDDCGLAPLVHQYDWLIEDLKLASSPEERAQRPWIVVFGHRPMYCSSKDSDECTKDKNILRKGLPFNGAYALEKLFYDYGVDVELYSHEHQYERFLPIYDGQVLAGTDKEKPYDNARAPVHVISGSAGCEEKLDPFSGTPTTGSVKQISDYGYTRLRATRCMLEFEQISDDQDGTIVDKFTISKNRQNFPSPGINYDGC